ncbi:hypothetical protein ACR6C2_30115 [Streptomyces sp. INA 01156]
MTEPGAETNRRELADTARFTEWWPATPDALSWEGPLEQAPAELLRAALAEGRLGHPGPRLSRYAWHRDGDVVHEFRLTGGRPASTPATPCTRANGRRASREHTSRPVPQLEMAAAARRDRGRTRRHLGRLGDVHR